ncbi:kynurenine/alpha-aminoadipate aminotransferase, mitochondrial-like [Lingula anatina]|uniref:Kynurenine/alpha-aminoadipate aminotransferase, mitochondrial-like n=1 Tax=Lingula anatina TaxID=7574 RepID=A0A1S3K491_LINAN|nr:kynurenine/alpha-aminoadipate aminotransferase, mitochondrial-like [Lingula anatina]|eukprot:XP_013417342.1 kynurenine/alpha-aminoadipate aminotransferase, mitochondrial-like [Lingula anatina]
MDYRRFLNGIGMRRQSGSYLTGLLESVQDIPDMISLAGGLPNPSLFPILSGTFKLKDGEEVYLDENTMTEVQQYSSSQGYPPFRQWCERFIKSYHDPPCWENADESKTKIMVTSGAAEAYTKVLEMCVKEGDKVLVEIPTFSSAIDNLLTLGAEPLGVQGDDHGMIPGELRSVMSKWKPEDADNPHSDVPKLILETVWSQVFFPSIQMAGC